MPDPNAWREPPHTWNLILLTLGRIEAKADQIIRSQDSLATTILATSMRTPTTATPTTPASAMGTPAMEPTGSLLRIFGPKALMWGAERLLSWLLPYLLPIGLLIWTKGWVWIELVWRSLRSALGL